MNPVEHHATVDKGLKMKIKRKNIASGSKSDSAKHEAGLGVSSVGEGRAIESSLGSSGVNITTQAMSINVDDTGSSVETNSMPGSMGSPSSTLDKLKQTLADKERKAGPHHVTNHNTSANSQVASRTLHNKRTNQKDKAKLQLQVDTTALCSPNNSHSSSGLSSATTSAIAAGVVSGNTSGSNSNNIGLGSAGASGAMATNRSTSSMLPASGTMVETIRNLNPAASSSIKKEPVDPPSDDPYEFNAKLEDHIISGLPVKKVKLEKVEAPPTSPGAAHTDMETDQKDIGTETCTVGVGTDPDCLGPCEPGTSVVLEGIVWNETENGILVVNITWRGKTYVGTLMDATKHAWAPPRFNCESPAGEQEARTPRGRGKRRAVATPPVIDLGERRLRKRRNNTNPYAAPPSPARSEASGPKRRGRPIDLDLDLDNSKPTAKRARTCAKNGQTPTVAPSENGFIECPEPGCSKKYRHMNGLRYHQTHAHKNDAEEETSGDAEVKEAKSPTQDKDTRKEVVSPNSKGKAGRKSSTVSQGEPRTPTETSGNGTISPVSHKKSKKEEKVADVKKQDKQAAVSLTPVSQTPVNLDNAHKVTEESKVVPSDAGASDFKTSVATSVVLSRTTVAQAATLSVTSNVSLPSHPEKIKKSKSEKKSKGNHSVVIAPTVSIPTSLPASLPSVTTHAQISIAGAVSQTGNGLKPIQPRPTVLGEPNMANTALAGLKEKKSKKRKNKDKDKEKEKKKEASAAQKIPQPSSDVILTAPNLPSLGNKPLEALVKMSNPPELQKQALMPSGAPNLDKPSGSPPELQKQLPLAKVNSPVKLGEGGGTRPPSSLSLNSPLHSGDGKDSNNANAQSPAYSDISDANENASMDIAEEDGSAAKNDNKMSQSQNPGSKDSPVGSDPRGTPDRGLPQKFLDMYNSYYPSASYLSPTQANRNQVKPTPGKMDSPTTETKGKTTPDLVQVKIEPKEEPKDPSGASQDPLLKASANESQMREYQERMMRAQQMAQYQQYMGAYGYGVDMRLLASNPEYKAQYDKWVAEQERARREYMEQQQKALGGKPGEPQKEADHNSKAMDLSKQGKMSPVAKPNAPPGSVINSGKMPDPSNNMKMKESSKLKDTLSGGPSKLKEKDDDMRNSGHPQSGYDRQQEEYNRRLFMYQQHRLMEQKRYMEQQQHPPSNSPDPKKQQQQQQPSLPSPLPANREIQIKKEPGCREKLSPYSKPSPQPDIRPDMIKTEKDKPKVGNLPPQTPPGGNRGKDSRDQSPGYRQYYGQGYPSHYPQSGHPSYDSSHALYPSLGMNSYQSQGYQGYPSHMRGNYPESNPGYKDGKNGGTPPPKPGMPQQQQHDGSKALSVLQQKAAYYQSHSPQTGNSKLHDMDTGKPVVTGKIDKMVSPPKDLDRCDSRGSLVVTPGGKEGKEGGNQTSPPPQRHVHTHHHTHLVGPAYSLYGPYGALMASQTAAAAASAASVSVSAYDGSPK